MIWQHKRLKRLANHSQDLFCGILDFDIQKDQSLRTKVIPLKPQTNNNHIAIDSEFFYLLLNEKYYFLQRVTIKLLFHFFFILHINKHPHLVCFLCLLVFTTSDKLSEAGTVYPSGAPDFPQVTQSLVFFFSNIVLSALRFTASDYPFGIFTILLAVFYDLVFDWMLLI